MSLTLLSSQDCATHDSDEVLEDGVGLPDDKVTVLVVNERGNTTVGVERDVSGGLLLLLVKLEVDGSVGESEGCGKAIVSVVRWTSIEGAHLGERRQPSILVCSSVSTPRRELERGYSYR